MGLNSTYLTKAEVQDLLGVGSFGMRRLPRQHKDFPAPEKDRYRGPFDPEPDGPVWDGTEMYEWAAATPQFRHRGAFLIRPLPAQRQPGIHLGYRDTAHGPATDWQTTYGVIRMLHTTERDAASAMALELAASHNRDIVTVCSLFGDIGLTGPALIATDTAQPRIDYEADWGRVAELVGQPLPWWPDQLRRPEVIRLWAPGSAAAVVEVPPTDREQTLRRAARNTSFTAAAQGVLSAMADAMCEQRISGVESEIQIFANHSTRMDTAMVVAAQPDTTHRPGDIEEDEDALRPGWKEIVLSSQPDAVAATDVALGYQPELLPYGRFTDVRAKVGTAAERWARRLTMCDPTAGHATLAEGKEADAFFLDPLTDMPVVRTKDDGDKGPKWLFYAPLALPAGRGELASVILQDAVWVTTTDGQIHPAPCTPGDHLWWGFGMGDRPTEAAHVINLLLDNLAAPVSLSHHWDKAPAGLTTLLNQQPKNGAELSRAALLHARMTPPKPRG